MLPGIIYPFRLSEYRMPCDLGTYLFYCNFANKAVQIDCEQLNVQNGQDLLELCMAKHAASFLADLVVPDHQASDSALESGSESGYESTRDANIRSTSSASESSGESAGEEESSQL